MATEIIFTEPYTQWDWRIAQYVALIGIAGGAYLTGYVADVYSSRTGANEHTRIAKYGYIAGLLIVGIAPPIMLTHLGAPLRAMALPLTMTNLASWMARGSYILGVFAPGIILMFGWMVFGRDRPGARTGGIAADGGTVTDGGTAETATGTAGRAGAFRGVADKVGLLGTLDTIADRTRPSDPIRLGIGAIVAVFAAGVLLYSAMALGSGKTFRVPLWDKTFLIPIQILGGLAGGVTVTIGLASLAERDVAETAGRYALAGAALLVAYLVALVAMVLALPGYNPEAASGVANLTGDHIAMFGGVGIAAGVVVPALLLLFAGIRGRSLSSRSAVGAYVVAAALVIVGKIAFSLSYMMAAEFTSLPLPV